jgi:hypothetical protein
MPRACLRPEQRVVEAGFGVCARGVCPALGYDMPLYHHRDFLQFREEKAIMDMHVKKGHALQGIPGETDEVRENE